MDDAGIVTGMMTRPRDDGAGIGTGMMARSDVHIFLRRSSQSLLARRVGYAIFTGGYALAFALPYYAVTLLLLEASYTVHPALKSFRGSFRGKPTLAQHVFCFI